MVNFWRRPLQTARIDLLLINLPKHGVNVPPLALPYLSAAVKAAGFVVRCRDYNLDLWRKTIKTKWSNIWLETDMTLYKGESFNQFVEEFYKEEIESWAEEIIKLNPQWLGISLFSYRSVPTLRLLVPLIRKHAPQIQIVLGGAPVHTYGAQFVPQNLADYSIRSEGDMALPELLRGNTAYPGILSRQRLQSEPLQVADLNALPPPDYSSIQFDDYTPGDPGGLLVLNEGYKPNNRQAGIMGSRGCVRHCEFCDVANYWPKFRWRSAENIFNEMSTLHDQHGVTDFYFHDSLLNGSISELDKLLDILISQRERYSFNLKGLAIIRKQPVALYKKLKAAGFQLLQIGVESFSERLRNDMRKNFSNELLAENLSHYADAGIRIVLLLMAGYPTETEKDHQLNLQWLTENKHWLNKPIHRIDWGGTTLILPGAPLFINKKVELYLDKENEWVSFPNNERNDIQLRLNRLYISEQHARKQGWRVGSSYAGGKVILGDQEAKVITTRPQDNFPRLENVDEMHWNPERQTVGFTENLRV